MNPIIRSVRETFTAYGINELNWLNELNGQNKIYYFYKAQEAEREIIKCDILITFFTVRNTKIEPIKLKRYLV